MTSVLVIGDVMIDETLFCSSERLSPEAPVPVAKIESKVICLGGAGNVANNLNAILPKVTLMGAWPGNFEFEDIDLSGINVERVCFANEMTRKTRILCRGQHLLRLDVDSTIQPNSMENPPQKTLEYLRRNRCDAVIISDYDKGVIDFVPTISDLKQHTKFVLVDPKRKDWSCYRHCDVITPNAKEFETAFRPWANDADLEKLAKEACNRFEIGHILLTRSEKGMSLFNSNGLVSEIQSDAKQVRDVTGAGDTVIATLCAGLLRGLDIEDAAILANKAAGYIVSLAGTQAIDKITFESLHKSVDGIALTKRQINEEKIIFTNGCFDILHPGHLRLLRYCRGLGGKVVVGLNSDQSVRRLKGNKRPVNNVEYRSEMLISTGYVDEVLVFDEDTPYRIITDINPNILVKGGDYKIESVVGGEFVLNNSGSVKIFDFISGFSTTDIIEKIKKFN